MQLIPSITFRGMKHSRTLESEILVRIARLERYVPSIIGCRVLAERRERHHEAGNRFHVRIDLTVPGAEIVVSHQASVHGPARALDRSKMSKANETDAARKHAIVAIHEAFEIARRRLQDVVRRQRGDVKSAHRPARGRVAEVFPIDRYGYIEASDGHQVYFQKSSVLGNGYGRLKIGTLVSYVEERGEKGPQASTVRIVHPRALTTGGVAGPSAAR